MRKNSTTPRYQKIALDIANSIYKGDFKEGEKIYGRSVLAGKYNVSPETIRRAIKLLEDVEVVLSEQGSGTTILSKEKAFKYINRFKNIETVASYKAMLISRVTKKQELEEEIMEIINKIIDNSSRLKNTTSITPYETEVPENSNLIGKSIGEVNFWQHTGATIVGIKRNRDIILSPGPYATFQKGDVLMIIGEEQIYESVKLYLDESRLGI